MNLFAWIIVGFLAAAIATRITGNRQYGCLTKIVIGVIGAMIGGALANSATGEGIDGFTLRSVLVSAIGATIFLAVLNAIASGRVRR